MRQFYYGLIILGNIFLSFSHANTSPFLHDKSHFSAYTNINKASMLNEQNNIIYNAFRNGQKDFFQVYQLNSIGQYELKQQLTYERTDTYNLVIANTVIIRGTTLFVIGRDFHNKFQINADDSLTFIGQVANTVYFFGGELFWLSANRFFVHSGTTVNFWSINSESLSHEYSFQYDSLPNANDHLIYDSTASLIWVARKVGSEINLRSYSLDDANQTMLLQSGLSIVTDSISTNNLINLMKYDLTSQLFFIKTYDKEFFISNINSQLNIVSQSDSISRNAKTFNGSDTFVDEIFTIGIGSMPYFRKINWNNKEVTTTAVNLYTMRSYNSSTQTYNDLIGTIGYLSSSKIYYYFNYPYHKVSIHSIQNGIDVTPSNVVLGAFNKLPTSNPESKFNKVNGQLMLTGRADNTREWFFYLWQYDLSSNDFSYVTNIHLDSTIEETGLLNFTPIGHFDNSYYLLRKSFNNETKLIRFSFSGNQLKLEQSLPLTLNGQNNYISQSRIVGNQIIFTHNDPGNLSLTICDLDGSGIIVLCEQKTVLQSYLTSLNTDYQLHSLIAPNQFLLVDKRGSFGSAETAPEILILDYDSVLKGFSVLQQITPQPSSSRSDYFPSVKSIFASKDDENIYLIRNEILHYQRDAISGEIIFSGEISSIDLSGPFSGLESNSREDYFVKKNGYSTYVLDAAEHRFFHADQSWFLNMNVARFRLLAEEKGFIVGWASDSSQITTFTLYDSKPAVYKGGLRGASQTLLQAEPFELDLRNYFVNGNSVEVRNLPPDFKLEHPYLRGTLDNEAMFVNSDPYDTSLVSYYNIEFRLNAESTWLSNDHLTLYPQNINDAPILIEPIPAQYLKKGDVYYIDFSQHVTDPDRESAWFTYENVPGSARSSSAGYFEISISTEGTYTITIHATDAAGATLTFNVKIIVNKTGMAESRSSGGGSFVWLSGLLVVILFSLRQKKYLVK